MIDTLDLNYLQGVVMANILIFDDEEFMLRSTVRTLQRYKFKCDSAADPYGHGILNHDCNALYAPCKDLLAIITDYYLSLEKEKNGLNFLYTFKHSRCVNKDKVILILSSVSMPATAILEAIKLGIKPISKPYNETELLQAIGFIP